VLDAVVPLTMAIPKNVAVDAQAAFDKLLVDCHEQSGCARAYPHLEDHFRELVTRLEVAPEEVTVFHPRTGEASTGIVDPLLINRLVRGVMYSRTLSRLLPLAIEEAFAGNYQPLSTLAYTLTGDGSELSTGMMASVLCSEDMKLTDSANDTRDFDNALYTVLAPICEFWPTGTVPEAYFTPVSSDVPVLLTSGKLDPITPPKYGWEASLTLNNSEHVVISGIGHGSITTGCMPDVVNDFINDPNPRKLNAGCTVNLRRPAFFTSYAGPLDSQENSQEVKQGD
ncbi:MAG: alpha/beta hydrolase, partial [Gammaproteobacteria bacterium]|nr:alpha/beta hydrolase [Gammaproteobacteria bacterium]